MSSSTEYESSSDGYDTPHTHRARTPPVVDMSQHVLDVIERTRRMEQQYRAMQDERDHFQREVTRLVATSKRLRKQKAHLEGDIVDLKWERKCQRNEKGMMEERKAKLLAELIEERKETQRLRTALEAARQVILAKASPSVS